MSEKPVTSSSSRYFALIPAAGVGQRMGVSIPKQYLPLAGKLVLQHVMDVFCACPLIKQVFVVLSPNDAWIDEYIATQTICLSENVTLLRCGGKTRRDSVMNGLKAISETVFKKDWVLVHDAARPGLTPELVHSLIDTVNDHPVGGLLALPIMDTVKRSENWQVKTIPREGLWAAQTPQMFRYDILLEALQQHLNVTDESSAIEAMGLSPILVEGHLKNTKITRPADMALVEMFLKAKLSEKSG